MTYEFLSDFDVIRSIKYDGTVWIFTKTHLLCEVYVKPKRVQALERVTFKSSIGYQSHLKTTDQNAMCRYVHSSTNGRKDLPDGCEAKGS